MTEYNKPLPDVTDPEVAPFWEGTKKQELRIRRCKQCGKYQWPPRPMCAYCHSLELEWVKAVGKGVLYTYTIGQRALHPGFKDDIPYGLVVIELAEGPHMIGNSSGIKPEELEIGMPMSAVFDNVTEQVTLVKWKPA